MLTGITKEISTDVQKSKSSSFVQPGSKTISGKELAELTFDDIRVQYYTGQSFIKSGRGRDAVYGYRSGLKTKIGDIEPSEWLVAANALIEREGETELLNHLIEWERETVPHFYRTKSELIQKATELHVARMFDNPEWVDYVRFNQRYRPEILKKANLVEIYTECCGKVGLTTQNILDRWGPDTIPCPHCGRHSTFRKATDEYAEKQTNQN